MNIINKLLCLKLNRVWQPIGFCTIKRSIIDLAAGISVNALDFEYTKDENGNYILDEDGQPLQVADGYPVPVDWDAWINLPVRSWEEDDAIHYCNGTKTIRPIFVTIAKNFSKMPKKTFRGKPSKEAIWIRDSGTCQYSNKKLKKEDFSVDHVIPKSKGGTDDWTNLVSTSKKINSEKGNKLNEEIGLKLIRSPKSPPPIPLSQMIREVKHPTWKPFLIKIDD